MTSRVDAERRRRRGTAGRWPFDPARPYWDLELARVGDSRDVPVELVVNGEAVARQVVAADGAFHDVRFDVEIGRSSWLALRIYPSSHSNPIFVQVGGKPIRASRKSAEWCRDAVDVCWNQKRKRMRQEEIEEAKTAYDKAREQYAAILSEAIAD